MYAYVHARRDVLLSVFTSTQEARAEIFDYIVVMDWSVPDSSHGNHYCYRSRER